jgi:DNA-binding HxlR family transcriptional regulator
MKQVARFGHVIAQVDEIVTAKWSNPVIRILPDGPVRFTRLKVQLASVSSDILTARLRDLEDRGIIQHSILLPPVDCEVYRLTPRGASSTSCGVGSRAVVKSFEGRGK